MRLRQAMTLTTSALLMACVVDVDRSALGKPCPCPTEGYRCDGGVCVESAPGGTGCTPLVTVDDFRPTWSTPESIRWDWTPMGNATHFIEYRVVVAATEADVQSQSGSARVFDRTVNPELAFFIAPHESSPFQVISTITDGLEPLDPAEPDRGRYYASLGARDINGCTFTTPIVASTTKLPPVSEIFIFDEELMADLWDVPLVVEPGCGHDGGACLRCVPQTCLDYEMDPTDDWDIMRLVQTIDLALVSENALVSGQAYLEVWIAIVSPTPSYYSEVFLVDHDAKGALAFWGARRLPLRSQTPEVVYQKIQLPLSALTHESGAAVSFDVLQTGFDELNIGAAFLDASEVRLDAMAVRW